MAGIVYAHAQLIIVTENTVRLQLHCKSRDSPNVHFAIQALFPETVANNTSFVALTGSGLCVLS